MQETGIQGRRVRLVPLDKAAHLENCLRWFNDPEVLHYLGRVLPMYRAQETRWFDEAVGGPNDIHWAILDEGGRHIGNLSLGRINWREGRATTGITIGEKNAWGQGYGTEAMQLRTAYAFEQLGLHRLESECFAGNEASARCLEKAGYRRVGVARKKRWRDGGWQDCILWEMLDEDYFGDRPGWRAREQPPYTESQPRKREGLEPT